MLPCWPKMKLGRLSSETGLGLRVYFSWLTVDGLLVGGLEHLDYFPYIGNFIIPTDFNSIIFQRGRSTTNQFIFYLPIGSMVLPYMVTWIP